MVLTTGRGAGRARGRPQGARDLPRTSTNYLNNWKRLGFTDEDVAKPGSDALGRRRRRVRHAPRPSPRACSEHLDAGADHVPVQVLTSPDKLVPALAELAGPLGLQLDELR